MKAIAITKAGKADTLTVKNRPLPDMQSNHVLIAQQYAGVNYGDVIRRKRGLFPKNTLFIPGFEGYGEIVSIGDNVQGFSIGDKVLYLNKEGGGYAQYVSVDEKKVYKVNDTKVNPQILTAMLCPGATALYLLEQSGVKKGDTILIHGATGSVGSILVQLAKLNVIKVIAIVGTFEKEKTLKTLNPDAYCINRNKENIAQKVKILTKNQGVDAIFDPIGQAVMDTNLAVLKSQGIWMYYGSVSGHSEFPGLEILMNAITLKGFVVFDQLENRQAWEASMEHLITLFEQEKLSIDINILPLEKAAEAHQKIENGQATGKYVLKID